MRFLLEKELDVKPNNSQNTKDIDNFIKELPNYNKIKSSAPLIRVSILDKGYDTSKNKFLDYINKVKWDLPSSTADIIYQLLENGNLNLKTKWLYSKSLYNDTPENINYKLKALVYASKPDLQKGANKEITPGLLMDKSGKIKSVEEIKNIINKIKVIDDSGKVSIQQTIEKNFGSRDITKQQNQQMVKNAILKTINSGNLKDKLPAGFEKSLQQFDLATIKNDKIGNDTLKSLASYIVKVIKNKGNEFSSSNKGKDLLRIKLGKNNFTTSNIIEYVASLVPETEREKLKVKLSTDAGKSKLASILSKDYTDTNLGDDVKPIDMLNSALKATFMTPDKPTSNKDTTKRSGQQILMQDFDIKDESGVFDFVNQTVNDSNLQGVKKDILKQWVKTNAGKNELIKILKKDYSSTLIGSDLDSMKADIVDLTLKAE